MAEPVSSPIPAGFTLDPASDPLTGSIEEGQAAESPCAWSAYRQSVNPMDECVTLVQDIVDTVKGRRSDALVLCHGGPIAFPKDAAYLFERVRGLDGFFGASSTERFPTEVAIRKQIEDFTALRLSRSKRRR
jgi:hypothetical protein